MLFNNDNRVYIGRTEDAGYSAARHFQSVELPPGPMCTPAVLALRHALAAAGFDSQHAGTREWNPFRAFVHKGERVVIKPNWVMHENLSGAGLEPLITQPCLIEAAAWYAMRAGAESIVIGDAPLQACDFSLLCAACDLDGMQQRLRTAGANVEIRDFRRVTRTGRDLWSAQRKTERSLDKYVEFDMGKASVLEPVTKDGTFRVTCYDPEALNRTHAPGRHRYLIARELLEADVVINMPKLKTHKKAGLTGALKNMVGANGHKEYLPHHRKGSAEQGGDCYERSYFLKRFAERALDYGNRSLSSRATRYMSSRAAGTALRLGSVFGADQNLEGSWFGNDTVWRMSLDLQMIISYGRCDGRLSETSQRRMMCITDGVIAGEGEGPLAPEPVSIGTVTVATNPAAADWVNAVVLGLDPSAIPLTRGAFGGWQYPLASFSPDDIAIELDGNPIGWVQAGDHFARPIRAPRGWIGRCEWMSRGRSLAC
jgi:uncharacterized protein (DUF362 family)